jgi:hypothetical protein
VTTVEVALVGYTLLILFRNILEGLRSVPPDVLEARAGWAHARQTLLARSSCRSPSRDDGRPARRRRLDDRARDRRGAS